MRKIALVGAHSDTNLDAPYQDPEWEIWACSGKNVHALPRWDVWFELHVPLGGEYYVDWLRNQPIVYVRELADLPGQCLYPEAEMREQFGQFFFTSSIAYMMALAISHEPDEIGLWGVHMGIGEEYAYQKPGCQYFIQKALDKGIEITVPPQSKLLEPPKEIW